MSELENIFILLDILSFERKCFIITFHISWKIHIVLKLVLEAERSYFVVLYLRLEIVLNWVMGVIFLPCNKQTNVKSDNVYYNIITMFVFQKFDLHRILALGIMNKHPHNHSYVQSRILSSSAKICFRIEYFYRKSMINTSYISNV
jgi:hypothetical protein